MSCHTKYLKLIKGQSCLTDQQESVSLIDPKDEKPKDEKPKNEVSDMEQDVEEKESTNNNTETPDQKKKKRKRKKVLCY